MAQAQELTVLYVQILISQTWSVGWLVRKPQYYYVTLLLSFTVECYMNENCIFLKNSSCENFENPIHHSRCNLLDFSMEIREAHGSYRLPWPWWSSHEWQRCSCKGWVRQHLDFYLKLYHTNYVKIRIQRWSHSSAIRTQLFPFYAYDRSFRSTGPLGQDLFDVWRDQESNCYSACLNN